MKQEIKEIPLKSIRLGKNSRLTVTEGDLSGLMESIKNEGLLQPIGVVKSGRSYEVCYGNRRFLSVSKLGWSKIPAVIHENKSRTDIDMANLAENIQRQNISIAEAGRYIKELRKEGLTKKEIAVRLGVSLGFISSCLDAVEYIPREIIKDIVQARPGEKVPVGKVSFSVVNRVVNASKSHSLNKSQMKKIIDVAKKNDERFRLDDVPQYAKAIKEGKKNFLEAKDISCQIRVDVRLPKSEYDRLTKKHVDNGPYTSLGALFKDVLAGKKSERVRLK